MPKYTRSIRELERGLYVSGGITIGMIICKLLQLFLFNDSKLGFLQPVGLRYLMDFLLFAAFAGLLFFAFRMSAAVGKAGELSIQPLPVNGISFLLAGAGLLIQGVLAVWDGFTSQGHAEWVMGFVRTLDDNTKQTNWLAILPAMLGLVSAASLLVVGIQVLRRRRPYSFLLIPPVLWSGMLLVHLMISYPDAVTMQLDSSKTIAGVLLLLFTLDLCEQYSYEGAPDSTGRYLLRFLFPCVGIAASLPYLLAALFGIRDSVTLLPYIALFGVSLCGLISAMQILLSAHSKLSRKRRLEYYR